jgi:hypothetical protein
MNFLEQDQKCQMTIEALERRLGKPRSRDRSLIC